MWETQGWSLGQEDLLEKGMATQVSTDRWMDRKDVVPVQQNIIQPLKGVK